MSLNFVEMNLIKAPYNLRIWYRGVSYNNISINMLTLNEFHYAIRQALSDQHSITKFEWDEELKTYKLEYGTRPLEYENIECAGIIQRKRHVAERVAYEALRKFPHNRISYNLTQEELNEMISDIKPLDFPRKWSKFEFRLYWNHQENCIQLCGHRLTGDRISYFDVWKKIEEHFVQLETRQRNLRDALLEANTIGDVSEEYLREYLVYDLV